MYLQGGLSILMLISDDMYALINYMSFVQWLSVGMSVSGLLYLRYKKPEWERPIKVRERSFNISVHLLQLWKPLAVLGDRIGPL